MAHNTVSVSSRIPIPLKKLLGRVAERRDASISKLLHQAACDVVAEEFGLTAGDGIEAAQKLQEQES